MIRLERKRVGRKRVGRKRGGEEVKQCTLLVVPSLTHSPLPLKKNTLKDICFEGCLIY